MDPAPCYQNSRLTPSGGRVLTCELCRLYELKEVHTRLYYEDERVIIVNCDTCGSPMAVAKVHANPVQEELELWMRERLREVADRRWGRDNYLMGGIEGRIKDHRHIHVSKKPSPP